MSSSIIPVKKACILGSNVLNREEAPVGMETLIEIKFKENMF